MSRKAKVVINHAGARAVLNDPAVKAELLRRAQLIREAAIASDPRLTGEDIDANAVDGSTRARAGVVTVTPKARNINAKHNTLLKSLDAGRG